MRAKKKLKNMKSCRWVSNYDDVIRSVTKKSNNFDEKYLKIKFNLDDELMVMKPIENPTITVDQGIFLENNIYYLQVFLDEWLNKLQKRFIMIELTF